MSLLLYRMLNRALDARFSDSSYAYRWRGFGVDRCQREIVRTLRTMPPPIYVLKRDISDFFASVDHAVLLRKLEQFIDPNDYLFELLTDCIRFTYQDDDELRTAGRGVPFGTAIACLFANAQLIPAFTAEKYCCPSSLWNGAHTSSFSLIGILYFLLAFSSVFR